MSNLPNPFSPLIEVNVLREMCSFRRHLQIYGAKVLPSMNGLFFKRAGCVSVLVAGCLSLIQMEAVAEDNPPVGEVAGALAVSREEMRESWQRTLFPTPASAPSPSYEILEKSDHENYEQWRVRYTVDEGETAVAWLLVPKPLPSPGVRLPLVLALHPTNDTGKDRVIGIYEKPPADEAEKTSRENRQYGIDLVKRGFVVFAPDRAAYGERRLPDDARGAKERMAASEELLQKKHPGWKMAGKQIWDLQRALDFLTTLDFVDPQRIGSIGHSLGAWDTVILGAMDDRIRAVVVSHCGNLRADGALWSDEAALHAFLRDNKGGLNTNLNILLMLLAPRSQLFLWSVGDKKDAAPNLVDSLRRISTFNQEVARKAGSTLDFSFYLHAGGHDFPPDARALAYQWLEMRLKAPEDHSSTHQTTKPAK